MKKIRVNMVSESDISVKGHGVHTAYLEMAAALEKRNDIEVIRGEFGKKVDSDITHLHTIGPYALRKLLQRGPKKVVSAHIVPASLIGSLVLVRYWLPLARRYMSWFYNQADRVLAVSSTVARILHDELQVPKEKIETFYNTVDMAQYAHSKSDKQAARQRLSIASDAFVVLGNGQVQPRKRIDIFVKMALALPDVQFIWVGGIPFKKLGADYERMRQLINTVPSNMKITGVIPHQAVRDYLTVADVFCLPAEQENHPMCVLEAAGASLPIIVRDIPEYNDTFGADVWRCQDDEFITAVKTLRKDKAVYDTWQQRAKKIAKRFDSAAAADRLVKLYRHLV